jgi:hypothetical protein
MLRHHSFQRGKAMLMRLAGIISVVSLVACVSPAPQPGQQTVGAAVSAGEPIAEDLQARDPWWQVRFADENQCRIQGFQEGTDALAQCVGTTIARQRAPHRCTYCRSLD